MSRVHDELKEQSTLLALGLTPDVPVASLMGHLAECEECRALVRDVHETAGRLPEALAPQEAPSRVRDRIMQQVRLETGNHESAPAHPETSSRNPSRSKAFSFRRPIAQFALAAALILLVFGNGSLWWQTRLQSDAYQALETRYQSELRWLRSAEYLLISGASATSRGELQPPPAHPSDGRARGQAALFQTPQQRYYLLIQVEGLERDSVYSVWVGDADEKEKVGEFTSTPSGTGSYVYGADAAEWARLVHLSETQTEAPTETQIALGVRAESTQQPVLTGLMQ